MEHPIGTLYLPAEAAYYLASQGVRMSAETVKRLVDAGQLAAQRTPTGRRLITRAALDALAEARRRAA